MPTLFDAALVGETDVKNRIFMAPLTRNRANPGGTPSPLAAEYYAQRASAGLIVTEATQISAMGKGYLNTPGIYTPEQVAGWTEIVSAVHDKGGKIFLQLWHVGRISHTSLLPHGAEPVAPSAIRAASQTFTENGMTDVSEPRALTLEEITQTVADYKHAAECAKQAGFDGVEVHAANGYLIDQFLQDKTNHRDDDYGGDVANRVRFLSEVLDAVTEVWDSEQVGVRLSPTGTFNDMGDSTPLETFGHVIENLNTRNLAYLHMVERFPGIGAGNQDISTLMKLRSQWQGFYISNGDYNLLNAQNAIQSGYANAITFGRIYIANPDLPTRFELGAELNEPDQDTFYGGGAEGYTDYPFLEENA